MATFPELEPKVATGEGVAVGRQPTPWFVKACYLSVAVTVEAAPLNCRVATVPFHSTAVVARDALRRT